MKFSPLGLALCILSAFAIGLIACGEDSGNEQASGPSAAEQLAAQVTEAGSNPNRLLGVLGAITTQKGAPGANLGELDRVQSQLESAFSKALTSQVKKIGNGGQFEKMEMLDSWFAKNEATAAPFKVKFDAERMRLWKYMLAEKPSDATLRGKLGFRKIETDLEALMEEAYLDSQDIKDIKELRKELKEKGEEIGGVIWVSPDVQLGQGMDKMLANLKEKKAAFEKRMEDPWEKKAETVFNGVVKDLQSALNSSFEFVPRTYKPYLLIIEKDQTWNETEVARKRADALKQLYDVFYKEYAKNLDLKDVAEPIPVVLFKRDGYQQYAAKRGLVGAAGHFEPGTGRLFTSARTDIGTIFHEGSHQLSFYNSGGRGFLETSYWFEEGLAEFLAGFDSKFDKENDKYIYEVGLLQKGRLNYWRQNPKKAYGLWELMDLRYRDREINSRAGDDDKNLMVYSQGWFLCYFMNCFNVDSEGIVQIGKPGIYREAWLKFFEGSLNGKHSRGNLLECLGMKDADQNDPRFKKFERQFNAYFEWANKKISMKHEKDKRFIPWDIVENRGKKYGDKIDDALYPDEFKEE